jgi:hypothetical protein
MEQQKVGQAVMQIGVMKRRVMQQQLGVAAMQQQQCGAGACS